MQKLLRLQRLNRSRQPRLRPGSRVRMDHIATRRLVELRDECLVLGHTLIQLLGRDRRANFSQLRSQVCFSCTIPQAANRVLPHPFLGTACIGHRRDLSGAGRR